MSIDEAEIAHWKSWIGKTESRTEMLDIETLRRFAAGIGEALDVEHRQPSLAHWAYFLPVAPADGLGSDGHPKRGGFLPPVTLQRRMFAASEMRFHAPLMLGEAAEKISTIRDVVHKSGRSGDLVLVQVGHRIIQGGRDVIEETQTIVYRDAGAPMPPVEPTDVAAIEGDLPWQPDSVQLFRFSAVTFNSHRIHYDLPYVMQDEGYPGLVVHGPYTATKLFGLARREERRVNSFNFRALAPLICGQRIILRQLSPETVSAIRCDGVEAMAATIRY